MKLLIVLLLLLSCSKKEQAEPAVQATPAVPTYEVIEIAPTTDYDNTKFTVVKGSDTSRLYFEVEHPTYLGVRYHHFKEHYANLPLTKIEQLALVAEFLKGRPEIDSVNGLFLRGLDEYGIYSKEITETYVQQFGNRSPKTGRGEYAKVSELVFLSSLVPAVDCALAPLDLKVESVSLEKIFLSPQGSSSYRDHVPDSVTLPDTLLHAMTWFKLKKSVQ